MGEALDILLSAPTGAQRQYLERLAKGMNKRALEELVLTLAEILAPEDRGMLFAAAAEIAHAPPFVDGERRERR